MSNQNRYIEFDLPEILIDQIHEKCLLIEKCYSNINLNFIPMNKKNLHMTVCFLGELSKNIKNDKKSKIDELSHIIQNYPKVNGLEFVKYSLFSIKNNLIVAEFKLPQNQTKNIIRLKSEMEKYGSSHEQYFTPHITLGKIMNCKGNFTIDLLLIPRIQYEIIDNLSLKLNKENKK